MDIVSKDGVIEAGHTVQKDSIQAGSMELGTHVDAPASNSRHRIVGESFTRQVRLVELSAFQVCALQVRARQ